MPVVRYNGPDDAVAVTNHEHGISEVVKKNGQLEVPAEVRDELVAREAESWSEVKQSSQKKED